MKLFSHNRAGLLWLLPVLLLLVGSVWYALLQVLVGSLEGDGGQWSLSVYQALADNSRFWSSAFFSVYIAGISTIISLILGIFIARGLYHYLEDRYSRFLIWIPMVFPHFVGAYLVILIFSQSGWLSTAAASIGWIETIADFPILTNDSRGIGLILTYVWKEIPFVVLMMLPVYQEMNKEFVHAAAALGAGPLQRFKDIEWAFLKPGALETGLIIFCFVFGAFEVPYLIGASSPQMGAVLTYEWFYSGDWSRRPEALAAMTLLTGTILTAAGLVLWYVRKLRSRLGGGA